MSTPTFDNGTEYPKVYEIEGFIHVEFEAIILVTRTWEEAKTIIAEAIRENSTTQ